jgi:hypothetical protein
MAWMFGVGLDMKEASHGRIASYDKMKRNYFGR